MVRQVHLNHQDRQVHQDQSHQGLPLRVVKVLHPGQVVDRLPQVLRVLHPVQEVGRLLQVVTVLHPVQ